MATFSSERIVLMLFVACLIYHLRESRTRKNDVAALLETLILKTSHNENLLTKLEAADQTQDSRFQKILQSREVEQEIQIQILLNALECNRKLLEHFCEMLEVKSGQKVYLSA
jgi:hypothetical protein